MDFDTRILEHLSSKICHDLISPIGAVNNGIEFLTEMGPDAGEEVTDLIAFSANQASAKLKAYRMAYGAGGADSSIKAEDVYNAIASIIDAEDKVTQEWDPHEDLGFSDAAPRGFPKMLICGFLLGMECLPKGGVFKVEGGGDGKTVCSVSGEDAAPKPLMEEALSGDMLVDELEPKYVHPYVTGLLAKRYGYTQSIEQVGTGEVSITLIHP